MNFWELLFFHHLIPWLIAEKIEDEWEGENTKSGPGGAGPGGAGPGGAGRGGDGILVPISYRVWEYSIHIPSRLEFGTGMGNDHTMWDGNGIRVPRPKPAPLPTLGLTDGSPMFLLMHLEIVQLLLQPLNQ